MLERSPAYQQLPPERRSQLARGMVRVTLALMVAADPVTSASEVAKKLAPRTTREQSERLAIRLKRPGLAWHGREHDDMPEFVRALVAGVFQATVDSSVQQMDAYAELVKEVAWTLGEHGDATDDDDPP